MSVLDPALAWDVRFIYFVKNTLSSLLEMPAAALFIIYTQKQKPGPKSQDAQGQAQTLGERDFC